MYVTRYLMIKPKCYTSEIQDSLNEIRETNKVNMFLVGSYLMNEFYLSENEADECILYWIDSYTGEAQ